MRRTGGNPLVSVVVATYRSDVRFLRRCLDSALTQDLEDIEVIVSDDSEDDRLRGFVAAMHDSRCVYRRSTSGPGPAENHASALSVARAPYVAILNHDDYWEPEFLAALLKPMAKYPEVVVAFSDHHIVRDDDHVDPEATEDASRLFGRATLRPGIHQPFYELVVRSTVPLAVGCVFRADAIPRGEPRGDSGPAYDLRLAYLLSRSGRAAYFCPERLANWRIHDKSLSHLRDTRWLIGAATTWQAVLNDTAMARIRSEARKCAARSYRGVARSLLESGLGAQALRWAARSLMTDLTPQAAALAALTIVPERVRHYFLRPHAKGTRGTIHARE